MPPWFLLLSLAFAAFAQPVISPAPSGPYRVQGNRILDAKGREYLIRGTSLPPVTLDPQPDFGPFSATTLITLRQRMNMNAVRLRVDAGEYETNPRYREFVKELVKKTNRLELLAILDSASSVLVRDFESNPNVFFAVPDIRVLPAGVSQPVIVNCPAAPSRTNIICQVPAWRALDLNQISPVLVTGLDPDLTHRGPECEAFPSDPFEASRQMETLLTQFDEQGVNWTISSMEPGKLIDNYRGYDWTKLDEGWTCGGPFAGAGIGMTLLAHLWRADVHGVFTVNQPAGGLVIARGANASAYGRILAEREARGDGFQLSNISVRVTDAKGEARPARLSWTGAGWSSTNLIIPDRSATGPAEVAIVRSDGSETPSRIIIADVAPGLWTATADGRGAVIGQTIGNGPDLPCFDGTHTVAIPLRRGVVTRLRLEGTGFRHASKVSAVIGGIAISAESFGPMTGSSRDQATLKLPASLIGRGETDVFLIADGTLSNVARINVGKAGQAVPSATPTAPARATRQLGRAQTIPPTPAASEQKIQLGRYLFYDKRMSVNNSSSCATCHRQDLAFTDGRAQALGATGQLHPRSAMSLVNLASATAFNWNDPSVHSLEQQALKPMRSRAPVELGLDEAAFVVLIGSDALYRPLFPEAFPQDKNPYTIANVARAIAAFERTIVSSGSPYDRFHRDGDESAISDSAKRGEVLFFLDGGPSCFRCHRGPNFSDSTYHNNGLGAAGKFKTPTLRNVALTAPYMHDGSIATLEQVVDHYSKGGKPGRDPIMRGFPMTPLNRVDLVAFLKSLTDETLLHNQRYGDPWPAH